MTTPPHEAVRYAVIGVGKVGTRHARAASNLRGVELVAVVDPDLERARRLAAMFGCKAVSDMRELGTNMPDAIEAVAIATPPRTHFKLGLDALERGWHVFMEKPLAADANEARQLVEKADTGGRILAVAHQYRLHHWAQNVKRILDAGEIGRPLHVIWSISDFRSNKYFEQGSPWRTLVRDDLHFFNSP